MQLTYKQIKEALLQVYKKEFDPQNGRQPMIRYDSLPNVPMTDMIYLLNGVGDRDTVDINLNIEQEIDLE